MAFSSNSRYLRKYFLVTSVMVSVFERYITKMWPVLMDNLMYSLQSQSTGIIFPEMIENLYGDDSKDDVLERIDIQLEEDPKTLRYENYFLYYLPILK